MGIVEGFAFSELASFKKNNIAIIGNMSNSFYEELVSKLSWNDTIYIFDTKENLSNIEFFIRKTLNSNVRIIKYVCYKKNLTTMHGIYVYYYLI